MGTDKNIKLHIVTDIKKYAVATVVFMPVHLAWIKLYLAAHQ